MYYFISIYLKVWSAPFALRFSQSNLNLTLEMPRVNEQFGVVRPGPGDRVKMEMNGGQVEDGGDSKLVAGFADFQGNCFQIYKV